MTRVASATGWVWPYYEPQDVNHLIVFTGHRDAMGSFVTSIRRLDMHTGADNSGGYDLLYLDLYETLRNGKPLAITPDSVRKVIAVLEECRRQSPLYKARAPLSRLARPLGSPKTLGPSVTGAGSR